MNYTTAHMVYDPSDPRPRFSCKFCDRELILLPTPNGRVLWCEETEMRIGNLVVLRFHPKGCCNHSAPAETDLWEGYHD